ncbi:hypothetical protein ACJJTC_019076 [Scirpophaga incertulas]
MAVFPAFFGLLMAALVTGQSIDITPHEAVRKIGDKLIVLCKVAHPIDSCRIILGDTSYRLIPNNVEGEVVYSGQGLEFGECGALIKNVKEAYNGNISCVLPPATGNIEIQGTMKLFVAKRPGDPQLISPPQPSFLEGEEFRAQCIVPNGRPAAKITWFLGEMQLLRGTHQPVVTSPPGSDLQTVSQNVTLTLTADDAGRTLVCRAEHEALDQPTEAKRQINVRYPPKKLESSTIKIFGLKLGEEGRLNVTVRANPEPSAEWRIGDVTLLAPRSDENAMLAALEPVHLGSGYYNVTLLVSHVTKEAVDRRYQLRVENDLGYEEFTVLISTMDEPPAVGLGAGAIVGIVVAVIILLLAVSMVVFAKATHRWCFAGRSHRTDIPDGADSEAPLPPHDDVKGSENPTHDHGDYIGNGDTKHPEKKPDTAV